MEFFLHRYRHLTLLVVAILLQLILLAYQVKSGQDVRLIRVWAVTAVTPFAKVIEAVRSSTLRFFTDYFVLLDVREENRRIRAEMDRIKLENQYLKTELATADRARALSAFQSREPSKTIAARVIGNGTAATAKVAIVDRGSNSRISVGMAVITPDGIVGKVIKVYPSASYVLLITDPTFAAGVVSQKNHVHGTVKGQGHTTCVVDYIQNEQTVEPGEWFYTSGDDRIFPKGIPVGQVTVAREGRNAKEVFLVPSGFQHGLEEVLIVLEGVHTAIPEQPVATTPVQLPPPPESSAADPSTPPAGQPKTTGTDADRMLERYKRIGDAQGHKFGEGYAFKPPDFNLNPEKAQAAKPPAPKPDAAKPDAAKPDAAKPDSPKPDPAKPPIER